MSSSPYGKSWRAQLSDTSKVYPWNTSIRQSDPFENPFLSDTQVCSTEVKLHTSKALCNHCSSAIHLPSLISSGPHGIRTEPRALLHHCLPWPVQLGQCSAPIPSLLRQDHEKWNTKQELFKKAFKLGNEVWNMEHLNCLFIMAKAVGPPVTGGRDSKLAVLAFQDSINPWLLQTQTRNAPTTN